MPNFPTDPDEIRRWIKVRDRNERIDDARWWTRGDGKEKLIVHHRSVSTGQYVSPEGDEEKLVVQRRSVSTVHIPMTDAVMARLATPAAAEDAVYLTEVVDALERMSGTEQAAWFLDAVEGTHTANDRLKVHRIRKRLRMEVGEDDV